jgi:hypothetical protein
MPFCPQCGSTIADAARFCPACGQPQGSASQMPTAMATPRTPSPATPTSPIGRLEPSESLFSARFTPGQTLGERYRIVGLIGRGGMGEVYRADDLKLGQPVSLKFLPARLAQQREALDRFHAEVRNARQVSHPNVCRVYDIGEFDGHLFLTMEFVDGEDLATLLRRIGRLPSAKANEVARQLCAGLAAAHDKGVLHRDLKPSNVMIDGHGRVRITDFGLAVRAEDGATEMAGTPAYMAPEQFDGRPVTARSDLYSLGLILYEIYTGQRAFEAANIAEWRSRHTQSQAPSPSSIDPDLEPAAERAIMRCLEKDPSRRPSSALTLAAALPGGDPLAAALAAGETPSPEMVAAAGGEGAASARRAWTLLAAVLVLIGGVVAIAPYSTDLGLSRFSKSRDVLVARAREIAGRFGYDRDPLDSEAAFFRNYSPLLYKAQNTPSVQWRREMRGWFPPIALGYRQSPRWMVPLNPDGTVQQTDPPYEVSGMVGMALDAEGRLTGLRAMPPQLDTTRTVIEPDWAALFQEAGLDMTAFREQTPRWVPPAAYDVRREWRGEAPWAAGVPLEVSGAGFAGKPVLFEVRGPWSRPQRMEVQAQSRGRAISGATIGVITLVVFVLGVVLARRNLRLGRGDRRGAVRLGIFLAVTSLVAWAALAHHVADAAGEATMFAVALGSAIASGMLIVLVYLALEPYVRRRMPELLIGWARVLEGRFRDPRVGHDVLVGLAAGAAGAFTLHLANGLPTWFSFAGQTTVPPSYEALAGGRPFIGFMLHSLIDSLRPAFFMFAAYFLLRLVIRHAVVAALAFGVVVFLSGLGGENPLLEVPQTILMSLIFTVTVVRFGLLSLVAMLVTFNYLGNAPLPLMPGTPTFAAALIVLLVVVGLALYAFRVSLGGRPVFAPIED